MPVVKSFSAQKILVISGTLASLGELRMAGKRYQACAALQCGHCTVVETGARNT